MIFRKISMIDLMVTSDELSSPTLCMRFREPPESAWYEVLAEDVQSQSASASSSSGLLCFWFRCALGRQLMAVGQECLQCLRWMDAVLCAVALLLVGVLV